MLKPAIVSRAMHKPVVISISAALVVGLILAASTIRSQSHGSDSSVGVSEAVAQSTRGVPGGTNSQNATTAASTVAIAGRTNATRGNALPQAPGSQISSQPASAVSANQLQGIRRVSRMRPWEVAVWRRMQATASGPSSRPAEPFLSTPEARMRAATPMPRRLIQAAGSQPSSQPGDAARLMQRRGAESPMSASYANLWVYASRAKAQTQSVASGPSSQPRSLASQAPRLHEVRRGKSRWATQAVSPDSMDESGHSESTGSQ